MHEMLLNRFIYKIFFTGCIIAFVFGCKEVYNPPQVKTNPNYLVVDGMLTSGDSTMIKLSRTRNINDSLSSSWETGASVIIVGAASDVYPLTEQSNGIYRINYLYMNPGEKYQLQITTSDGKKYVSDSVVVKQTPLIDSVNWTVNGSGVQIYVNTHDQLNSTQYYRWIYEETWEYHAAYDSYFTFTNDQLIARDLNNHVYTCWHNRNSTELSLASSAGLSQDIIYQNPILFIPHGSEKISLQYSILVKQYALTKEAYEYWENLKKGTELTGGLFDPQPSLLNGNIHCISNPDEKALGFIGASSVEQKRIFIKNNELDSWGFTLIGCTEIIVPPDSLSFYFGTQGYIPVANHGIADYSGTTSSCADCTLQGGTTIKPSYWP